MTRITAPLSAWPPRGAGSRSSGVPVSSRTQRLIRGRGRQARPLVVVELAAADDRADLLAPDRGLESQHADELLFASPDTWLRSVSISAASTSSGVRFRQKLPAR